MSATAAQIARLRRLVGESIDDTIFANTELATYIEEHPLLDERGENPYTWDTTTDPPSQDANELWVPTYDLNAAAADIWEEKAAILAQDYDFEADGSSYTRSQAYEQAMKQVRYFRSKRSPRTVSQRPEPFRSVETVWVANLAEVED